MVSIFLKLLNMSIAASWIVLAVMLLRLLLKKAPKWINCLLWSIVALRLMLPVNLESALSLIPSPEVIPQNITTSQTPAIHSGIPVINSVVNPLFTEHFLPSADLLGQIARIGSIIWIVGVTVMLLYGVVSYWRLRWQVRISLQHQGNVYYCDDVASPFVLGMLSPRIYLPSGVDREQLHYILAHEYAHIRRRDHWWKPLGFLLLSIYWFNPLLWVAYIFLCRDIEQACDEKVIAGMDTADKTGYSLALAACNVHRRTIMACPVAFGELGVRARIQGVLNYKKPAFWIIAVSAVLCMAVAVCFLTNPTPCDHAYSGQITMQATCTDKGMQTFSCHLCDHSYAVSVALEEHAYDEGKVLRAATCTQSGMKEHICTVCGAVKRETIKALGHAEGQRFISKEPNCTQTGEESACCTRCNAMYVISVLPINNVHAMEQTVLQSPTCTQTGEGYQTCTRCGHSEECVFDRIEHDYKHFRTDRPTCTHQGEEIEVCTMCRDVRVTKIPIDPNAHSWSISYTSKGEKIKESCRCGKTIWYETTPVDVPLFGFPEKFLNEETNDSLFPTVKWDPQG